MKNNHFNIHWAPMSPGTWVWPCRKMFHSVSGVSPLPCPLPPPDTHLWAHYQQPQDPRGTDMQGNASCVQAELGHQAPPTLPPPSPRHSPMGTLPTATGSDKYGHAGKCLICSGRALSPGSQFLKIPRQKKHWTLSSVPMKENTHRYNRFQYLVTLGRNTSVTRNFETSTNLLTRSFDAL